MSLIVSMNRARSRQLISTSSVQPAVPMPPMRYREVTRARSVSSIRPAATSRANATATTILNTDANTTGSSAPTATSASPPIAQACR